MMLSWLLLFYLGDDLGDKAPLERVIYDVELVLGTRLVHLKMVVNRLDADHFSISSRKSPGGTLFTYWATPESDVLSFPKSKLIFEGRAGQSFALFPHGPRLDRAQWLRLLEEAPPEQMGSFVYQQVDAWKMIGSREEKVTLRWRERKRRTTVKYRATVLTPRYPKGFEVAPIEEMALDWKKNDLD